MDLLTEKVPLTMPTAKPGPMTDMERFIFECYGYIVIENVLSQDEIEENLLDEIGGGINPQPLPPRGDDFHRSNSGFFGRR